MKNPYLCTPFKIFLLLLLSLSFSHINAQVAGDYRTIGAATFSSTSNWQVYNGSSWVTATAAPYTQPSSTTQATSGSTSTTSVTLSAANTFIYVGQFVTGTNIAAGTTVSAVSGTSLTLSQAPSASVSSGTTLTFSWSYTTGANACTTNSTTTVTVPTTVGLAIGQYVTGTNMPSNATVASIVNGTSITISAAATASSTTTLTFYSAGISATLSSTSNIITLGASNPTIAVGQYVSGSSIQPGVKVLAVSGTTITLSEKPSGSRTTNLSFGYFTIPDMYINHNVTLDNNVANTIGNIYVNNSSGYYSAGTSGITPTNATFSIGVSGYGVSLTCGTINIATNATVIETNIAAAQTNTVALNGGDGGYVINNNGTLDFTTKGATATNITFATSNLNNNANSIVGGSGSYAFNLITTYMGYTAGNVVDMQSVFTMATASTTQTLTLSYGTLQISSASTITPLGSTATSLGSTAQIVGISGVTATWTAGTNTITCSTTGLAVGMPVSGTGVPTGSVITAVGSSTVTINSTGLTGTGASINFGTTATSGLTLNNASAIINTGGGTTSNPAAHQIGGVINITSAGGTINWGSNTNPVALSLTSGGQLYMNGGTVNVYGGYNAVANGGYTCIAGGTLSIPAGGSINTTNQINGKSFYIFGVSYNNSFIMTGGNLNIASHNSGFNANGDFYLDNTTGTTSFIGGTVSFSDASLIIFGIYGSKPFYNLTVSTGGGLGTTLLSVFSNVTVNNTLTVNSSNTLDVGANALTLGTGGVAGTGTINTQYTGSSPFGSFTGTFTGTVNFNGGTQTIPAATYNNLTISNARSATAISGATTYASSKIVTCGSFSLSGITNGMTISGTGITTGTTVSYTNAAVNSVSASWTGTTTVTCSVTGIYVGMAITVVSGSGFPTGATVASVGSTSITISSTTTATGSGTLNFSSIITLSANAASAQANTTLSFASNLTLASGTVNIAGAMNVNYTGTISSFTTTSNSINLTGAKLSAISAPFTVNSLTINAGDSLALAAAVTTPSSIVNNGVLELNTGGSVSNTISYGSGSTIVFNQASYAISGTNDYYWPSTNGPTNVAVLQALNLNSQSRTIATSGTFYAGAAITSGTSLTVNGTLQLNAGGSLTGSPILGNASYLVYNTGTSTTISAEWNAPANVTINAGTTLLMGTQAAAQTITGSLLINGGLTLSTTASPNGDLIVYGNWTHANTGAPIALNNRNITFGGSGTTTITNSGGGTETFYNLTINKTSGGVSLSSPTTITNTLTLTNGIVATNANQLSVTNTANSAVTGSFGSTSFINGALAWTLPASSSNTYLFPIGSGSSYYPLSMASPSTSTSSTTVATAQVSLANSGGSADNTTISAISGVEYWSIVSSIGNITGGNISLTRTGVSVSPYNLIGTSASLAGTYSSIAGTVSGSSINTSNSIGTISNGNTDYFVLGEYSSTPTITGITGGATATSSYIGQLITINGANFASGTTVSFNGGSAYSTTFVSSSQIKITIPASATSGNITANVSGTVTNGYSFSILGYTTAQAGDWSNPSTWVGGAVPPANAVVSVANPITVSTSNYSATVSTLNVLSGASVTFSNSDTIYVTTLVNNGTINMSAGGVLSLSGTSPSFTNNGTFTYGIGTVAMNGTSSNTIIGQNNFYNVNVGGTANLCNDTLYGTLTLTGTGSYSCSPVGAAPLPTYSAGQTVTIYASPNGSGIGSGATYNLPVNLTRARIVVQNYPNNPCNILLEDGTYYQYTLTSADSRTANAPAIYKAINRGNAIFKPLKVINRSDFQPIPDSIKQRIINTTAQGKVMQLNLSSYNINAQSVAPWANVISDSPKHPIFYQNTTPLMLSRYPNDTTMKMNGVNYKGTNSPDTGGNFNYTNAHTNYWVKALNDEGVWLAGNWRVSFVLQWIKTKSIDTINRVIYQTDGVQGGLGNKFAGYAGNYAEPYFVSNLFEEIDTIGEYSINFNNKMLYMWVPDTGTIQYADSLTMPAISATGANNTQFQNIFFTGGAGAAITVNSANNIRIAGCDITQCTNTAIMLNDVTNSVVQSNDLHQLGSGGIALNSTTYNTDINTLKRCNDTVKNNFIYDYAQQAPLYNAAINPGACIGVYIANNKVRKCPHIGIAFGFGAGDISTFEYNEVDSVVLVYSDMGAIYGTGIWKDRGHKFNHNYLHDNNGANGLYLDNDTSGDTCVYNIVANSIYGMVNNGGNYNRFFNNIIINQSRPVVSNYTTDTVASYIRDSGYIKNLYYGSSSSATWQSRFPELADMTDTINGINKAFTSQLWSQIKNNAIFTFGSTFSGQTFTYVSDASLFNADGTTNNTYAQTSDPFVRWGTVFQNNYKVTNKLINPIYPFKMDSLRTPGILTLAGATAWHINRIGLYTDSFRTSLSSLGVQGIAPTMTVTASGITNHIYPDTTTLVATVINPNIANCISSIQFLDNNSPIAGLTITKTSVSYDTVTYTATWSGAATGNHSITLKAFDSTIWQYTSSAATFTTDTSLNWTGAVSTDWGTAANWSANRIPTTTDVVAIPSVGITRMPTLSVADGKGYVKRLTVKTGATLTLNDTLVISGDLQSSGTITGTSTIQTSDASTTPLPLGQTWTVGIQYASSSSQTVVAGNYSNLNIAGGPRILSAGIIGIAGNYTVTTSTLITTGSTVNFNGTGTQTISGATSFNNLQLNKSGSVNALVLGGATTVTDTLTLTTGRLLSTATNTLTVTNTSPAFVAGGNSSSYVDGPLSLVVTTGNSYVFPVGNYATSSAYLPDTIVSVSASGTITVTAFKGNCGGSYNSTLTSIGSSEYWSIQSSVANTIALTITPISLGSYNLIGQSATSNGTYVSTGGTPTSNSISATNISLSANTNAFFVAAVYPNATITSVTSCITGIAAGSFYTLDTLTIVGNYFQTTTTVTIGGQPATILNFSGIPTQLIVLVSSTASTGVIKVGAATYAGTLLAGYVTRNSGGWNTGSTWLGGSSPSGSAIIATVNNTVTLSTSVSNVSSLTITSNGTLTASNIGLNFISGATFTNNGTYTGTNSPSINGTITNNGTMTFTGGTMSVTGSLTINGTNSISLYSVNTSGSGGIITFTTSPSLAGNFYINAGFSVAGNAPTYGAVSTLLYNTGNTYTVGGEWKPNVSSGAGIPNAVQIGNGASGSSITFTSGNSYKTAFSFTVNNTYSLSVPSGVTLLPNNVKVYGTLTIANGATVQSASTVTVASTGTINVGTSALSAAAINGTNPTLIVTTSNLNDTGTVNNYGYIKMTASSLSIFNSGSFNPNAYSVLEMAYASPPIPTATWNANSYLYLTGISGGSPTNIAQTFGNVVWNSTSQTGNISVTGFNSIAGSFIVLNTGTGSVRLNNTTTTWGALQVGGSASINGSTVNATAASLNIGYSTAGATQVNGNVTIGSNGVLAASTASTSLALTGNWSDAGTFTNANTTIIFNGSNSTTQTINKTGGETFNNLTINTAGSGGSTLGNAASITTTLALTSGNLFLGNNNLTVATMPTGTSSSYIVTNGMGVLTKNSVSSTAIVFPVGTATAFTPLTVTNTSGTSNISVGVSATITNAVNTASQVVNLQWSVTGSAATTASMTYQFNTANEASSFAVGNSCDLGIYNTSYAVSNLGIPSGSNPYTLNKTGIPLASGTTYLFVLGNTGAINCTAGSYVGANGGNANLASNWCGSVLPTSSTNVIIANTTPQLTSNLSVNNLTLNSSLNLNGYNLIINGTASGSGTITGNTASSLSLLGTGTLYFDQSTPGTTNVLNNLTINTAGTVAFGNGLNLLGTLTPTAGTLNTGGYLTLVSTSVGTARIDQVFGTISGNITVQRFIPAKTVRKFSYVGSPVSQSIRNAWQQQVYITGSGTGGVACGSTTGDGGSTDKYNSNGFDVTQTNTPSMFTYNATKVNGSRYVSIGNTDQTNLVPGTGYAINIRGNRNSSTVTCVDQLEYGTPTPPEAVTLSATGTVNTGPKTVSLNDTTLSKYTLIANPYPSQLSFTSFQAANSSKTYNKMWTYSPFGSGNYTTYSAGVIANAATGYDNTSGDRIASGQAFFVEATPAGSNNTVTFQESHKISGAIPNTQYFGTQSNKLLRVSLQGNANALLDEVIIRFNQAGTKTTYNPVWDAESFNSGSQVLTTIKGTKALAIATLPDSLAIDTAQLGVSSNSSGTFQLSFSDYGGIDSTTSITLLDKFLGVNQNIRTNQVYTFNVTADTASQGKHRFEVVFSAASPLPISFINVSATQNSNGVSIKWKAAQEQSIANYEVERSTDGSNFTTIALAKPTATATYTIEDADIPTATTLYYRIQAVGKDGTIKYSNVASLTTNHSPLTTISIIPNPVQDKLNITLGNAANGNYNVHILSALGKTVYSNAITTVTECKLSLDASNLAGGVYIIELIDEKGIKRLGKFVKN